jgi:RsiW-degrading membrane proteinase PrsW (M82 family)
MTRARALWKTGGLNLLFQAAFLGALFLAGRTLTLAVGGWLQVMIDLGIVLVPCVVWTVFFYLQDRVEPEPVPYVLAAVFVGMALASLAGLPIERSIAQVDTWLYSSRLTLALGGIFVVGALHGTLFYAGIRYGFYPLREFDEPVDGVVYGAFIGSGYATVLSYAYLGAHPGMTLFAAGYTASTNIVIYASIASLVGFFAGKAKYSRGWPQQYFLAGLILSAGLIGLYHFLTDFALVGGSQGGFALSFGLTLLFACVILAIVFVEMRRLTSRPVPEARAIAGLRPDWAVVAVIVVLFVAGSRVRALALRGTEYRSERYGLSLVYPRSFVHATSERFIRLMDDNVLGVQDLGAPGLVKCTYAVTVRGARTDLETLALTEFVPGRVDVLSVIAKERVAVAGATGMRLKYSYVEAGEGRWDPELVLVYADVVPRGDRTFVFSYKAGRQGFEEGLPAYEAMLRSVAWTGDGGSR